MNTETKKSITINGKVVRPRTCPICKSKAYINVRKWNDCWGMGMFVPSTGVKVACECCGCSIPEFYTTGQTTKITHELCVKALNAWNNRA